MIMMILTGELEMYYDYDGIITGEGEMYYDYNDYNRRARKIS